MRKSASNTTKLQAIHTLADEALMQRLSSGELACAAALFDRYQKWIYNFFLRLEASNQELSQDLTQSVFERMIRYRTSYRTGASFKTWIFQIARNVRADHYKKNRMLVDDFAALEQEPSTERSVEHQLTAKEQKEQLYKALDALPEAQREVIVLTRFQQLKYSEVGKLLACTEGAVKVKVHRAIKALKDQFFKLESR
ncbi:MAG: RNA polymerase sigma factor [Bacteroidota bacterium]